MESCKLQDPLLQPAPLPLCGYEFVFSMWTVRDENTVDTRQEPTKTVMILWPLDRRWQQVRKMVITRIVSTNLLFSSLHTHEWKLTVCKLTCWPQTLGLSQSGSWAKTVMKPLKESAQTDSCVLHEQELRQSHSTLTASGQVAEMTKRCTPSHPPWSYRCQSRREEGQTWKRENL